MNIIIIEDEIITAMDLKNALKRKGYNVMAICKTYQEVLAVLEAGTPDLFLIDIKLRLSSMDGIQIAEAININNTIPIIFLTSQSENTTFDRAKHLKPAAYLFKPFRPEELIYQIELAYNQFNQNSKLDPSSSQNLFLPYKKGHRKVAKDKVLFIKAEGSYVNIYIDGDSTPVLITMNIGYILQYFLAANFFKLSRSYIINLEKIDRIDTDYLYFENSEMTVHIPKSSKQFLFKQLTLTKTPQTMFQK
jgi:DNA-binding LytR/AlgR family response regulator